MFWVKLRIFSRRPWITAFLYPQLLRMEEFDRGELVFTHRYCKRALP
jgi:hypothetical protein